MPQPGPSEAPGEGEGRGGRPRCAPQVPAVPLGDEPRGTGRAGAAAVGARGLGAHTGGIWVEVPGAFAASGMGRHSWRGRRHREGGPGLFSGAPGVRVLRSFAALRSRLKCRRSYLAGLVAP